MALPISDLPRELLQRVDETRHRLHRRPELSLEETESCRTIADRLRELELDAVAEGVGGTGVVGLLRGPDGGRTVALRADMDALPIREQTGLEWASERPGVMHACGHDGHMAVLLGVAELLAARRAELPGTVKFIFQPGEEGFGGARRMVEDGCLKAPAVDAIFAFHGAPKEDSGRVLLSPTPYAAMTGINMVVRGSGGHGAYPHTTIDPVMAAAQIIVAGQTIVSREIAPADPAVLSFCAIEGGTRGNIIPEEVTVRGTIRAMRQEVADRIWEALGRVANGVAAATRATVTVTEDGAYPPVLCDPDLLDFVGCVAGEVVGPENVGPQAELTMGAEDFAFYLPDQGGVPGVIFKVGTGCMENLHTPRFDFGTAALRPAVLLMANIAWRFLDDAGR